jgi:hypothetical protein
MAGPGVREAGSVRMRFDADADEDAAHATREALVLRFARWRDDHPEHGSADPWDVDLILSWKWGYGDGDYGLWTRAEIDEVLIEHLPSKLTATPDEVASIPPSIAAFAAFLDDENLLDHRSDPANVLADRALALRSAFLDAMDDRARFGMAKRFFGSSGLGNEDTLDQDTLDAAMAAFNELPFDQRGEILGLGADEPDELDLPVLPLRELANVDDLASLTDGVPLLRKVDAFHAALGPSGAKLTQAGNLTLADGRRLVAATNVADVVEQARSTAELPELFAVAQVAQLSGATEVVGGRLRSIERWTKEPAHARWQRVVDAALDAGAATLAFGASTPMPLQLAELGDQMALHLLAMLWIADEPVPAAVFIEMMEEAAAALAGPLADAANLTGSDHVPAMCCARIADVLTTLADVGIVALDREDRVTFTDAGSRLAAAPLTEVGFGVLLPEDVAGLDASGLIDALVERDGDDAAVATRLWTSNRSADDAARELAGELTAHPDPARVVVGFSILQSLGADAIDAVQGLLVGPVAGHAWLLLAEHGAVDHDDAPPDLVAQAGIDLLLATADLGSPADVIEMLLGSLPTDDHGAFVDTLAATSHPRTAEILDLLARNHPDEATATYARKAALRWRTQVAAARGQMGPA